MDETFGLLWQAVRDATTFDPGHLDVVDVGPESLRRPPAHEAGRWIRPRRNTFAQANVLAQKRAGPVGGARHCDFDQPRLQVGIRKSNDDVPVRLRDRTENRSTGGSEGRRGEQGDRPNDRCYGTTRSRS